jgi:catechol 2,3-dioxygenase-like lactoylglutathione lyase family enzyme
VTPSLSLLVLYCSNLELSHRFYSLVGLDLVREQDGGGPVHYSAMLIGTVLELYPAGDGVLPPTRTRLALRVDDPTAAAKALREAGFSVAITVAEDPDGNAVLLDRA